MKHYAINILPNYNYESGFYGGQYIHQGSIYIIAGEPNYKKYKNKKVAINSANKLMDKFSIECRVMEMEENEST